MIDSTMRGAEIYTDSGFISRMKAFLFSIGLNFDGVDYSEQGMQGYNYVSCDADDSFISSWIAAGHPVKYV